MTDERLILAIGRLERALARVESRALAGAEPARSPGSDALRAATAEAIARIDALLGKSG